MKIRHEDAESGTLANRQFLSLFDDDSAATFADRTFERCLFTNCVLANTDRIDRRSTVTNVTLTDCRQVGCAVGPAILEDVLVDGLDTADLLIVWGALFRRVTLRHRVGSIKINPYPQIDESDATLTGPFDQARHDFYAASDWALDISEAVFRSFDATGIPARLVRRDPETQAVVRRKNIADPAWRRKLAKWNTYWPDVIDVLFEDGATDAVLVAPKGVAKVRLRKLVDGLANLRDLGVADPD